MPIVTYNNGIERKIIGTLDPDRKVFSKKVSASKHLFKKLDAWGVDAQYLNDVLAPADYTIKITDTEEHIRYQTTAKHMLEKGTYFHFKSAVRDYGAQVFLPRSLWKSEKFDPKAPRKKFVAPAGWPKLDT